MSISSVSNSTFNRVESYSRRPVSAEATRSSVDETSINDFERQPSISADHGAGQISGGLNGALTEFKSLADVLASLESESTSSGDTSQQLQQATDGFQSQFADAAQDKESFHSLMQTSLGDKYNKQAAESIRQQTLAGDFSWMPAIKDGTLSSAMDTGGTAKFHVYPYEQGECNLNWGNSTHDYFVW